MVRRNDEMITVGWRVPCCRLKNTIKNKFIYPSKQDSIYWDSQLCSTCMPTSFQNRCKLLVASQMAQTVATLSTAQLIQWKAFLHSHFQPTIHSMFYIRIMKFWQNKCIGTPVTYISRHDAPLQITRYIICWNKSKSKFYI